MTAYQTTEYNGKIYQLVSDKPAIGDLIIVTKPQEGIPSQEILDVVYVFKGGHINAWHDDTCTTNYIINGQYSVIKPIEDTTPEPSPQLAGIYDILAKIATEVARISKQVNRYEALGISDVLHGGKPELTSLQLAILNAKDTPADVKLLLIVEAGRLGEQRKETIKEAE